MLNLLWRAGVRIRAFPASVRLPVRRGGAVVTSRVRSFAASAQGHGRGLMARFDAALDQRPWTTNLVVCVALYAVGDTIEQGLEWYWDYDAEEEKQAPAVAVEAQEAQGKEPPAFDWARMLRMSAVGVYVGPMQQVWYNFIDGRYPHAVIGHVVRKCLLDQIIFAPVCDSTFYMSLCLLERRSWEYTKNELSAKFLPTLLVDTLMWPAAQFIGFFYVSNRYRVTYVSILTLFWTILLSAGKHTDVLKGIIPDD